MSANQQKKSDWKEVHTALAAIAITLLVGLWNIFATGDRNRVRVADEANPTRMITLSEACSKFAFSPSLASECYSVTRTRVS